MGSVNNAASSILEQTLEIYYSNEHNAKGIREILVLCDFENYAKKDQISIIFELESQNTPAKGARLVFKKSEPQMGCKFCGKIFPYPDTKKINVSFNCPRCGSDNTHILSFEVMVKKIKLKST